ncbi:MAG TPA: hypothetical protein VL651_06765 [Bacteroidia bacterium]|jgi:hypothetical protein|nr:hypothetical protein [Bacteroidia bacterium]
MRRCADGMYGFANVQMCRWGNAVYLAYNSDLIALTIYSVMARFFQRFIVLVFYIMVNSCDDPTGTPGAASDMSEAKSMGIFVKELYAPGGVWRINDTLQVHVESAWIEHRYRYPQPGNSPTILSGYQIQVESNEKDLKNYDITWKIGIDGFAYFRSSSYSSLLSDLEEVPDDSLLVWKVQKGTNLSEWYDKVIIGEVRLKSK